MPHEASYLLDPAYRRHCWHGRRHNHATPDEARECINRFQPGVKVSRIAGCTCKPGHIFSGCPLHSPITAAYRRAEV